MKKVRIRKVKVKAKAPQVINLEIEWSPASASASVPISTPIPATTFGVNMLKIASYGQLKEIVNTLDEGQTVKLAQVVHGRLYKMVRGEI